MKRVIAVLALAWTGCANVHVNRATLIASTAALVCDWGQTHQAASERWGDMPGSRFERGTYESNPFMGRSPSTGGVNAYFAVATAVNAMLWLAMPERFRSAVPLAVVGAQFKQIDLNATAGRASVCGL